MGTKIENYIFDIGNVLTDGDDDMLLKELVQDEKIAEEMIAKYNVFNSEEWKRLDAGLMEKDEAKKIFKEKLGIKYAKYVDIIFDNWYKKMGKNETNIKLAKDLKKMGYKIFILSNAQTEVRNFLTDIFGEDFFNGIVISQEEKQMKPGKEIFETLINRYNIVPEKSLFIDDSSQNVKTAQEIGFNVIQYTKNDEQVKDIIKENVSEDGFVDLHIHPFDKLSNKDGVSIKEILKEALKNKTYLISLTSHNSLKQYDELYETIEKIKEEDKDLYQELVNKIKIVIGVEINTKIPGLNPPRDLLVYGIPIDKIKDVQEWLDKNTNKDVKKEYQMQILEHLKQVADEIGIEYDENSHIDDENGWAGMVFANAIKKRVDYTLANILTKDNPLSKRLKEEGIAFEKPSDYVNALSDENFLDNHILLREISDIFYETLDLKLMLENDSEEGKTIKSQLVEFKKDVLSKAKFNGKPIDDDEAINMMLGETINKVFQAEVEKGNEKTNYIKLNKYNIDPHTYKNLRQIIYYILSGELDTYLQEHKQVNEGFRKIQEQLAISTISFKDICTIQRWFNSELIRQSESPFYFDMTSLKPEFNDVLNEMHSVDSLVICAHPFAYCRQENSEGYIKDLISHIKGIDGIEALYTLIPIDEETRDMVKRQCAENGILSGIGGTDYHIADDEVGKSSRGERIYYRQIDKEILGKALSIDEFEKQYSEQCVERKQEDTER